MNIVLKLGRLDASPACIATGPGGTLSVVLGCSGHPPLSARNMIRVLSHLLGAFTLSEGRECRHRTPHARHVPSEGLRGSLTRGPKERRACGGSLRIALDGQLRGFSRDSRVRTRKPGGWAARPDELCRISSGH